MPPLRRAHPAIEGTEETTMTEEKRLVEQIRAIGETQPQLAVALSTFLLKTNAILDGVRRDVREWATRWVDHAENVPPPRKGRRSPR